MRLRCDRCGGPVERVRVHLPHKGPCFPLFDKNGTRTIRCTVTAAVHRCPKDKVWWDPAFIRGGVA